MAISTKAATLKALLKGPQTSRQIASKTKRPVGTVGPVLSNAKKAGIVKKDGYRINSTGFEATVYTLTPKGQKVAAAL
jgi:hypothetical protein